MDLEAELSSSVAFVAGVIFFGGRGGSSDDAFPRGWFGCSGLVVA